MRRPGITGLGPVFQHQFNSIRILLNSVFDGKSLTKVELTAKIRYTIRRLFQHDFHNDAPLGAKAETGKASAKSIGAMNKISWRGSYCGNPPNFVGIPRAVRPK